MAHLLSWVLVYSTRLTCSLAAYVIVHRLRCGLDKWHIHLNVSSVHVDFVFGEHANYSIFRRQVMQGARSQLWSLSDVRSLKL